MREILFRGKRIDNGEWAESPYPYGTMSDGVVQHDFTSQTVGQYTGLTDENDVKIFEGDIIRRKRVDGNWYNYEVFWWENCWGIKGGAEVASLILPLCGLQVIGNIHDDPELLEAGKENT